MIRTTKWALTLAAALLFGGTAHASAISLWTFDDDTSPTADTGSAGVNSLALQNGATFSAFEGGYALALDGVDDYAVHGAPAYLPAGAAARSVAAWIYPTYTDPAGTLVAWGNGDLAGQDFMVMIMKVGDDTYLFTDGENAVNNIKFPAGYPQFVPPANQWSHVAFTYDGNTHWRFYLNGDEKFSGDFAAPLDTAGALGVFVGRRSDGVSQPYFPGKLDLVGIYDTALTAAEVQAMFDANRPTVTALYAPSPVAMGAAFNVTATVSDVGSGGSLIAGATYSVDGGAPVAMTANGALDTATEGFHASVTIGTDGTHEICVVGTDANGFASDPRCTSVKVYDQYATISGNYKSRRGEPDLTYSGFVALSGAELLGHVTINYKLLGTSCTFTPDGDSTLTIVDGDYALLMHWTRTCSNGSTGTDSDLLLTDVAGTTYPPANGIRLDDNVADMFDISTPGVPLALTNGSVHVVDLNP